MAHRTQTNHATPTLNMYKGESNASVHMIMVPVANLSPNFPQITLINPWTHTNNSSDLPFLYIKSENQLPVNSTLANYPPTNSGIAANSTMQVKFYYLSNGSALQLMDDYNVALRNHTNLATPTLNMYKGEDSTSVHMITALVANLFSKFPQVALYSKNQPNHINAWSLHYFIIMRQKIKFSTLVLNLKAQYYHLYLVILLSGQIESNPGPIDS